MSISVQNLKFDNETKLLDAIYLDMIEAIHAKPETNDIEALNVYLGNVVALMNRTVNRVKEIKKELERDSKIIHETWNPPA